MGFSLSWVRYPLGVLRHNLPMVEVTAVLKHVFQYILKYVLKHMAVEEPEAQREGSSYYFWEKTSPPGI
jgi:hypothetical protein